MHSVQYVPFMFMLNIICVFQLFSGLVVLYIINGVHGLLFVASSKNVSLPLMTAKSY